MTPDDIEVDENGTVTMEGAYFWMGKFPPNVWKDSSGLWHAKVPADPGNQYTERERAKALISQARNLDYLLVYRHERSGNAAYNPAVVLEQITEDWMSVWGEVP